MLHLLAILAIRHGFGVRVTRKCKFFVSSMNSNHPSIHSTVLVSKVGTDHGCIVADNVLSDIVCHGVDLATVEIIPAIRWL